MGLFDALDCQVWRTSTKTPLVWVDPCVRTLTVLQALPGAVAGSTRTAFVPVMADLQSNTQATMGHIVDQVSHTPLLWRRMSPGWAASKEW